MILCGNPKAQYLSYKSEIDVAIRRVLKKGTYILGDEVKAFEREFTSYLDVKASIGVGSGTEALHLALAACGIGPGDEVLTVSHTAVATAAAIQLAGAKAIFVDVEPDFYTLDPDRLASAITSRTKAIVPVHLYGQAANLGPILKIARKYGLRVIEDCSQAHGALYQGEYVGAWGDMGCFSFYPTKNMGAIGDGGMVVTNNRALACRARLLREYGWAKSRISRLCGWNTRLDEIQAAILRVKLRHLNESNARRVRRAKIYDEALEGLKIVTPKIRKGNFYIL